MSSLPFLAPGAQRWKEGNEGHVLPSPLAAARGAARGRGLPRRGRSWLRGELGTSPPCASPSQVQLVLDEIYVVVGPVERFDRERAIKTMRRGKRAVLRTALEAESAHRQWDAQADAAKAERNGASSALGGIAGDGMGLLGTIIDNIQVNKIQRNRICVQSCARVP